MKIFTGAIVLLLIFLMAGAYAQVGPSISAGIDKIAYQKGELDADLIVELVSTKQQEAKKAIATRLILGKIECGSFAGWNFARKSIDLLLTERKEGILKKEMLKNVAELAVVMGISEFYLASLKKKSQQNRLSDSEKKFLLQYFKWTDINSKRMLSEFMRPEKIGVSDIKTFAFPDSLDAMETRTYYETVQLYSYYARHTDDDFYKNNKAFFNPSAADHPPAKIKLATAKATQAPLLLPGSDRIARGYLPIPVIIDSLGNKNSYEKRATEKDPLLNCYCDLISPNHILIDMVYDVCRQDLGVLDLDLFHNIGVTEEEYNNRNKHVRMMSVPEKHRPRYHVVYKDIQRLVNFLFKNSTMIAELTEHLTEFDQVKVKAQIESMLKKLGYSRLDLGKIKELKTEKDNVSRRLIGLVDSVRAEIENINLIVSDSDEKTKRVDELTADLLAFFQRSLPNPNFDYITFDLKRNIVPIVVALQAIAKTDSSHNIMEKLESLRKLRKVAEVGALLDTWIDYDSLIKIGNRSSNDTFSGPDFSKFALLLDVINNYDQAEYYDMLIKFIGTFGNVYSDKWAEKIVGNFSRAYDKYTALDVENNTLDFDVESMAVDIYETYAQNNSSRFSAYFTVGVNYGISSDPYRTFQNDYIQSAPTREEIAARYAATYKEEFKPIYSVNYVSEKIGVKYKVIDRVRRYSFGPPSDTVMFKFSGQNKNRKPFLPKFRRWARESAPKNKPLMTDVHLILYGSGILYNINHLNSESRFNKASYGLAAGVSFFNGIDFNIGYSTVFGDKIKYGFTNIGFDISISEYLAALRKKKR